MEKNKWENRRKKNKVQNSLKKPIIILLMLSFISFMSYHIFLSIQIADEKLRVLEIAKEDVAELRLRNLELVLEKTEIVSAEYLEKEARDKLRYGADDEKLFLIAEGMLESNWVEDELKKAKGEIFQEKPEKSPEEVFDIWVEFLFKS